MHQDAEPLMDVQPSVSFIIPTLNSGRVLGDCLRSIKEQDYPPEKMEVIVADGGSTDNTLGLVGSFRSSSRCACAVVENPLKTGEAGKAAGVRAARGEILAFVDSDNVLPASDWLGRMVEPFTDEDILASEPIAFTYRPEDNYLTRYAALLGMNDPLCLFIGNYDRMSVVTGRWTDVPVSAQEDRTGYLKIILNPARLPTMGANGFLIRREALARAFAEGIPEYLFDVDVLRILGVSRSLVVAKVKTGIVHLHAGSLQTFVRKQRRRIRDYQYFSRRGERAYDWRAFPMARAAWFVIANATLVPLVGQALKGFLRHPDTAWFFHPLASLITLWVYGVETIKGLVRTPEIRRHGWRQ